MFRIILTATAISLGTLAIAQSGNPGAHFVENWDLNDDGRVTLAEATERRGDIFVTFDSDDNGVLDPDEHDMFDEARANDMRENGMGQGQGQGKGQGKGRNPANGMLREVTDANGDGQVTRDEFMAAVPTWFARMDRDADGAVTVADFGPGH